MAGAPWVNYGWRMRCPRMSGAAAVAVALATLVASGAKAQWNSANCDRGAVERELQECQKMNALLQARNQQPCEVNAAAHRKVCAKNATTQAAENAASQRIQDEDRALRDAEKAQRTADNDEARRKAAEVVEQKALLEKMAALGSAEFYESATLAQLGTAADDARIAVERLEAIMIDVQGRHLVERDASVAGAVAEVRANVDREIACRSNKGCLERRAAKKAEEEFNANVVVPMCLADQQRESAQKDMDNERANPSGYLLPNRMYNDGAQVQQSQRAMRELAPSFVKVRHRAFRSWHTECHPTT